MSSFKKLVWLVSGLILLTTSFMNGCTGTKQQAGKSKKIVLRFSNAEGTAEQIKIMKNICEAFEKENPDIKINTTYGTTKQKILIELAADTPPDVFMWWEGLTDLKERDALMPLGPYIKKYNVYLNRYFKGLVDFYTYDGEIYGMPLQINTDCIVFNKNLFDKEKVPYPKEEWTWQEYYDIARKLSSNTGNSAVKQFGSMMPSYYGFLLMQGSNAFDFDKQKCVVDTKENRVTMEFLLRLYKDCSPSRAESAAFQQQGAGGAVTPFLTGRIAMAPVSAWVLSGFTKITNFRWDVAPLPRSLKGKKYDTFDEACLVMTKKSKHPEEAFKFVNFYCGEKGMKIFATGKNGIPADKAAAKTIFLEGLPVHSKYFIDSAEAASIPNYPRVPNFSQYMVPFNKYLDLLFLGDITMDEAMKNITREVDVLLKQNNRKK